MRFLPPSPARLSGFSLIELLAVVGISTLVVATLAGAMNGFRRTDEVKHAALEFQSMVGEATRIARQERSPVRLAFILPENRETLREAGLPVEEKRFQPACRLLLFKVPGRHLPATIHLSPLDGSPPVPLARLPRFETMVGRWHTAPGHLSWKRWTHHAVIGGDLIDDWKNGGFSHCAPLYQINPPQRWSATADDAHHPLAVYPMDFEHTPFQPRIETVATTLPASSSIRMKGMPPHSPRDIYQDASVPHWKRQDNRPFGSPPADESLALPALDFNPDGSLARRDVEVLRFHFSEANQPETRWTVHVRTHDAHTWIE